MEKESIDRECRFEEHKGVKIDCIILLMVFAVTIFGYAKEAGQGDSFPSGKWVDLSHDYSEETPYWPTADGFKLTVDFNGMTEGGYYYAANSFCGAEHGAPILTRRYILHAID